MGGPTTLRPAALSAAMWLLGSTAAWAVYNGIPPATSITPDDVEGVTVKLPDQPPQQAVDRDTCEKTKKPGDSCPIGYDWFIDVNKPLKPGGIIDVTFTGAGNKTIADGQFAVNTYGKFGDWLRLDVHYGSPAGGAQQGFSLPRYQDGLTRDFERSPFGTPSDNSIYFQEFNAWWDFTLGGTEGSQTTSGLPYKPAIRMRKRCSHLPQGTSVAEALRQTGLVPVTGYKIPLDDGGGYIIGGYPKLSVGQGYEFITDYMINVDEPRTGTGTGTGTQPGPGTQPGTGTTPKDGGPTIGEDGYVYPFNWETARWTETVVCRKELQNGGAGTKVNVRPKAPDAKDFVEGKNTPQWDPAKDGKGPSVANADDPKQIEKLVKEAAGNAGNQIVEVEVSDGETCVRTLTRLPAESMRADVAPVTMGTTASLPPDCPYPTGKVSVHLVDEEVHSVFTFGSTETYKDLADIAAKLQAKVAPHYDPTARCGKCIEQLDIWGHGDTGGGYISFGPNDAVIGNQNMGNVDQGLAAIGAVMCVGGKVVVNQCKAGTGNKGSQALQQMADKIGVPVSGADGKLKACRIFGGALTSYTTANPGPGAKTPDKNQPGDVTPPSTASK